MSKTLFRFSFALLLWMSAGAGAQADYGTALALAAESQIGVTKRYDPAYRKLAYPGGDVPMIAAFVRMW